MCYFTLAKCFSGCSFKEIMIKAMGAPTNMPKKKYQIVEKEMKKPGFELCEFCKVIVLGQDERIFEGGPKWNVFFCGGGKSFSDRKKSFQIKSLDFSLQFLETEIDELRCKCVVFRILAVFYFLTI